MSRFTIVRDEEDTSRHSKSKLTYCWYLLGQSDYNVTVMLENMSILAQTSYFTEIRGKISYLF